MDLTPAVIYVIFVSFFINVFRLVSLYSTLPKKVGCPGELKITWMESHHHFEGEEFEGRAELVAFYAW